MTSTSSTSSTSCEVFGTSYESVEELKTGLEGKFSVAAVINNNDLAKEMFESLFDAEDGESADLDAVCDQVKPFACASACLTNGGKKPEGCDACPSSMPDLGDKPCLASKPASEQGAACDFALGPSPCCHTSTEDKAECLDSIPGCVGSWPDWNKQQLSQQWVAYH